MHFRYVFTLLQCCVPVGLDWAKPMMYLSLHVTCSCIFMHTYLQFIIFLYIDLFGVFPRVSLSPSLSFLHWSTLWHLNANPLRPRTLFVLRHPLLLLTLLLFMYSSMMIKPERTFHKVSSCKVFQEFMLE